MLLKWRSGRTVDRFFFRRFIWRQHVWLLHVFLFLFSFSSAHLWPPSFIARFLAGILHMRISTLGNLSIVLLELFILATGKMTIGWFFFHSSFIYSFYSVLLFLFIHNMRKSRTQKTTTAKYKGCSIKSNTYTLDTLVWRRRYTKKN